jgi:hypothetical protein
MKRQQIRRELFTLALSRVDAKNLTVFAREKGRPVHCSGMVRRDRRKLARAYAAADWRAMRDLNPIERKAT